MTTITIFADGTKIKISGIGTLNVDEFRHLIERREPTATEYAFAEALVLNKDMDFDRALTASCPEAAEWSKRKRNRAINRLVQTRAVTDVIKAGLHEAYTKMGGKPVANRIFGN